MPAGIASRDRRSPETEWSIVGMSDSKARNVLLVGVSPEEAERVAPFLGRSGFGVDRFPGAAGALDLLGQVPFDLLIVRFPLEEINVLEVLQAVRKPDSACLQAPSCPPHWQ